VSVTVAPATRLAVVVTACLAAALAGCSSAVSPADLDVRNDACGHCRMTVSDPRFASQIVSPGEEPRFFDDLGCLRAYLEGHPSLPDGSQVFVASYRTRAWIPAHAAAYLRSDAIETPMGSHYAAFADAAEREPDAAGGQGLSAAEVFKTRLPSGGGR
jgi:copper chaperone NosL